MRHAFVLIAAAAAVAACDAASSAPAGPATPATLKARLEAAKGGETIRLAPGDYGVVTFPRRTYAPAIVLDAGAASFTGLVLLKTGGVTVRGGRIDGPGTPRSYGISIRGSDGVRIQGMRISGAHRGIVLNDSQNVALVDNELTGLRSDGINVALSRKVLVQRNRCHDFTPELAVFDAAGKKLRDGDHPDCIQAWSRPTHPPVSDVQVLDNVAEGRMQGIFFGNHVRDGVDDGGFDRVTIRGNRLTVNMLGITLGGARDSVVENNRVDLWNGPIFPTRPNFRLKPGVLIKDGNASGCGNVVTTGGANSGKSPCGK